MWGVLAGDIIGSSFEFANHRSKYFELFRKDAYFTDDTVCTAAIADILESLYPKEFTSEKISDRLRLWCCTFLNRGFGSMFYQWIVNGVNNPYNSLGNGALMRISPVALYVLKNKLDKNQAVEIAYKLTEITHNHEQALLAVKTYVEILYDLATMSVNTVSEKKKFIANMIEDVYGHQSDTIEKYRINVSFDVTAKNSLLVAVQAILESDSFEDVMYNVISVGGDSDTYAAIAGAIAEMVFGVPIEIKEKIKDYFNDYDQSILNSIATLYK